MRNENNNDNDNGNDNDNDNDHDNNNIFNQGKPVAKAVIKGCPEQLKIQLK